MATAPHTPEPPKQPAPHEDPKRAADEAKRLHDERAAEARKIFDENEKDAEGGIVPVTTQTDQLVRSAEMERVGPTAWMEESERRIRDRQGDPPAEPRQVHGVAPVQRPR